MAARQPSRIAGLALICPLLAGVRDLPEHRVVVGSAEIGDDEFRSYFAVQIPDTLERIGESWELTPGDGTPYVGPTLIVAGRLDSTVGYVAAADLMDHYPHAALAVLDDAGHALPHEQPELLRALVGEWLSRRTLRVRTRAGLLSRPVEGRDQRLLPRACGSSPI